jgi:hypothetical protein
MVARECGWHGEWLVDSIAGGSVFGKQSDCRGRWIRRTGRD